MEGDVDVGRGEEVTLVVLPSDEPAADAVPGRPRLPVGEADDKDGVLLSATPGDGVAGVHVRTWDADTSLPQDGPRTDLQMVLVPLLPCYLVRDLLRLEETGLAGQVWTGDDKVALETSLASLVTVLLQLGHLNLQAGEVFLD